jgi:3-methyladenine DNA glycosylase AlkD
MRAATAAIAELRRLGSPPHRAALARYAIPAERAFGVPMAKIQALAKTLGRDHALAQALWESGWYEARLLACYVDEPAQVTAAQMDAWRRGFDSWAIVDTACFALFDRTPHAWRKVAQWAKLKDELGRRAAFALIAGLVLHDKQAGDAKFVAALALIEAAADDARNFVKKGVSWALRCIGKRNVALNRHATALAKRLAESREPAARWIGKDALRDLATPATARRLAR